MPTEPKPPSAEQHRAVPPSPPASPSAPTFPRGRPWIRHIVAIALLLAALGILAAFWLHSHYFVTSENAYVEGNITPVSAEVPGTVVALYTDDNMVVRAGEPLAQVDPVPYQLQVDQAGADLRQARAEADALEVNVRLIRRDREALLVGAQAKRDQAHQGVLAFATEVTTRERIHEKEKELLNSLKAQAPGLEALARNAKDYFTRFTRLAATGDVPVQDKDNREATYREAVAKLEALRSSIAAAERQVLASELQVKESGIRLEQSRKALATSQAEVSQADAAQLQPDIASANYRAQRDKVTQLEARLRLARLALSNCLIRAPQGGIVSKRTIQLGQTLTARQPFLSIVPLDLNNVWVVTNLREEQMAKVRVGMSVRIGIDAIPDQTFQGWVESVAGGTGSVFSVFPPDNATGNFTRIVQRLPVRVRFSEAANFQDRIRPGLSARVWIDDELYVRKGAHAW